MANLCNILGSNTNLEVLSLSLVDSVIMIRIQGRPFKAWNKGANMSPRLPVNNSQTITDFLNLHKSQMAEDNSEDSYRFAFDGQVFLSRRETLGLRFQLELLKPEILLHERGIEHTITVFGSTRFVSSEKAQELEKKAKHLKL